MATNQYGFKLGIFFDDSKKVLILGVPDAVIEDIRKPGIMADIPIKGILRFAKLPAHDIHHISVTSMSNFEEMTGAVEEKVNLWDEFIAWKKRMRELRNNKAQIRMLKSKDDE